MSDPIVPDVEDVEREETLALGREIEIAAGENSPILRVLREALAEAQAAMEATVGARVMRSDREVDQRHLDYTRGYYAGANHWLDGRIALAKQRVAASQRAEGEDPRPAGRIDPRTGNPREESGRT